MKTSYESAVAPVPAVHDNVASKATSEEASQHLASYLPATYKGEKLTEVKYDTSDGCVYGKYATKKVKKQIFASENC